VFSLQDQSLWLWGQTSRPLLHCSTTATPPVPQGPLSYYHHPLDCLACTPQNYCRLSTKRPWSPTELLHDPICSFLDHEASSLCWPGYRRACLLYSGACTWVLPLPLPSRHWHTLPLRPGCEHQVRLAPPLASCSTLAQTSRCLDRSRESHYRSLVLCPQATYWVLQFYRIDSEIRWKVSYLLLTSFSLSSLLRLWKSCAVWK